MDAQPPLQADKIAKDLKFFLGEDWSEKYKPTPAALAYVKYVAFYMDDGEPLADNVCLAVMDAV